MEIGLHSAASETVCAQRSTHEYDNQQRPPYTEALGRALLSSFMHGLPPLPPLDGLLEVDESAISVFWFCTPKPSTSLNAHAHTLHVCVSSTHPSTCAPIVLHASTIVPYCSVPGRTWEPVYLRPNHTRQTSIDTAMEEWMAAAASHPDVASPPQPQAAGVVRSVPRKRTMAALLSLTRGLRAWLERLLCRALLGNVRLARRSLLALLSDPSSPSSHASSRPLTGSWRVRADRVWCG